MKFFMQPITIDYVPNLIGTSSDDPNITVNNPVTTDLSHELVVMSQWTLSLLVHKKPTVMVRRLVL
jgi:hypothetical protein